MTVAAVPQGAVASKPGTAQGQKSTFTIWKEWVGSREGFKTEMKAFSYWLAWGSQAAQAAGTKMHPTVVAIGSAAGNVKNALAAGEIIENTATFVEKIQGVGAARRAGESVKQPLIELGLAFCGLGGPVNDLVEFTNRNIQPLSPTTMDISAKGNFILLGTQSVVKMARCWRKAKVCGQDAEKATTPEGKETARNWGLKNQYTFGKWMCYLALSVAMLAKLFFAVAVAPVVGLACVTGTWIFSVKEHFLTQRVGLFKEPEHVAKA
jgi:hypothetical protein